MLVPDYFNGLRVSASWISWFGFSKNSQESGVVIFLFLGLFLRATSRHPAGPVCSFPALAEFTLTLILSSSACCQSVVLDTLFVIY